MFRQVILTQSEMCNHRGLPRVTAPSFELISQALEGLIQT